MKIILSFLFILIAISPSFHIKTIDEQKDMPYELLFLIIITIIWMLFLYYKEHHDNEK